MTAASKKIPSVIKQEWKSPSKMLIHWDDTTMSSLDGSTNEKKLPVVVSCLGKTKLLGAHVLRKILKVTYGAKVTGATVGLLNEWKFKEHFMVFDTTSSNTGPKTGACISFQKRLGKPLLWLPFRHHIGEVWKGLFIEPSSSPGRKIFQDFKTYWHTTIPNASSVWQIHHLICNISISQDFIREDYLEVVQLVSN